MQIFGWQKGFLKKHVNSFGDTCFHVLSILAGPKSQNFAIQLQVLHRRKACLTKRSLGIYPQKTSVSSKYEYSKFPFN